MSYNAPGKHFRKGLTVADFFKMFPDDDAAEAWFIKQRWPTDVCCIHCGSVNVQTGAKRKRASFRCREKECAKQFSTKTGTFMQASKIGYRDWLFAMYLAATNLKSVSSMKMHRDLGITQKSAWFLAHRIRRAWRMEPDADQFDGPVEVDETYVGGRRRNMSNAKRKALHNTGRGPAGKTAVVGMKDRSTNQVAAKVVELTNSNTLQGFVKDHATPGATVYTDEATAYELLPFDHATVKHSVAEYVRGQIHTNGIESFWSMLKRAHKGIFHKLSPKHLDRYVQEFAGRHNIRALDTLKQISSICASMEGNRLRYQDLIADNGLASGART